MYQESYPVLNGLVYSPGTVISVRDLYGSQTSICDAVTHATIASDDNGSITLKAGCTYELLTPENKDKEKTKPRRRLTMSTKSANFSKVRTSDESINNDNINESDSNDKQRIRTSTAPAYSTASLAKANDGFFKTLRQKGFNTDMMKTFKKEKEYRRSVFGGDNLLANAPMDVKTKRISFLESKGIIRQNDHLDDKCPPEHEICYCKFMVDNNGVFEKKYAQLKYYHIFGFTEEKFLPEYLSFEISLHNSVAYFEEGGESKEFRVIHDKGSSIFQARSKEEALKWVGLVNTISSTLTAFMKRNNLTNPNIALPDFKKFYVEEYLRERKNVEADLSPFSELAQALDFNLDSRLTEVKIEDTKALSENDKITLEKFREKNSVFTKSDDSVKGSKQCSLFEFINEASSAVKSTVSIADPKALAWKKLLVSVPNIDEGIETTTEDRMINHLVDQGFNDLEFMNIFLLTYRHIMKPHVLLEKLIERFNLQLPDKASPTITEHYMRYKPVMQLRILAFVKKWVQTYWSDFLYEESRSALSGFLLICRFPNLSNDSDHELDKIYGKELIMFMNLITEIIQRQEVTYAAPKESTIVKVEKVKTLFDELDYKEIAIYLTAMQYERLCAIKPIELIFNLWGDQSDALIQRETKALIEMINFFNNVSYWVATEVCTQPEVKNRQKAVEKFIKISKAQTLELKKMNNFNCLIAMISGLNLSAVSRLKQTWEGIQPKYMTAIQELEAFASPEHNYKNYRAGLDEIDPEKLDKVGCIPFFGLFVKDLTFVNDGNPARFQKEYINFSKLRIVYDKIVEMQFFQSLPYSLPEVSNVTKEYIDNMRSLKEPALYKYSCLCEAKGGNGTVRMIDKWAKDNKH